MLLDNNSKKIYTNPCLSNLPYITIVRSMDNPITECNVIMTYLTEQEESDLDKGKVIELKRENRSFSVQPTFCFCYGAFDFAPDGKDMNKIKSVNWFNNSNFRVFMPSEYDYNNHTVTSDSKIGKWYDTTNPSTFIPYLYACIGKPERVVIFKLYDKQIRSNRKTKIKPFGTDKYKEQQKAYRAMRASEKRKAKISKLEFKIKLK